MLHAASSLDALAGVLDTITRAGPLVRIFGQVTAIAPSGVRVSGLAWAVKVGEFVYVKCKLADLLAQVIAIEKHEIIIAAAGSISSVSLGDRVTPAGSLQAFPHASWKGRMLDALAQPIDAGNALPLGTTGVNLNAPPPPAMNRQIVSQSVTSGVKAIDVFTPLCFGQRVGIFAGSGVGKSTLLAMLAKSDAFDTVVVALIGERGREVREFVEEVLGPDARRAILVVATSDEPPVMRKLAANLATSIAEHFRDAGNRVLLIMDSVTRYAQACREIALSAGEPPVARGYPPSVFSELPQLLERAGPGAEGQGSITGIYTVLVDGDDMNDPVSDTVRGTLDGHIVLDRTIAAGGRYPAIDILQSVSRLSAKVWSPQQAAKVSQWKRLILRFEESRDLRALGGYVRGADPELDAAIAIVPQIYTSIEQRPESPFCANAFAELMRIPEQR